MNVVVFASDSKGLSSLNSIIQEAGNREVNVFAMITKSTTLKHPSFHPNDFEIITNVESKQDIKSETLGVYLPFKPDWLIISRERWNPEEEIIKEFKFKFNSKVGLVEPNSWIIGSIEAKLETESRNRFKDLIDVFFTHSSHSKNQQKTLGFKGNMEVVGNPKYDINLNVDSNSLNNLKQYYKVDSSKKQILLFSLVNSNRTNLNNLFKKYIHEHPEYQYFYKPYPGEPYDPKFRKDYYPNFILNNCTPIVEESHVWGMFSICDTHIGCLSSIVHASLLLNKKYIDLSNHLDVEEEYLNIDNILKKSGVGLENNVNMWLRTFKLSSPKQLTKVLNKDLLNNIKENNKIVWNNLDNPEKLLTLFDDYNDNQSAKRIINYILNGNI